jgi:hypothetical protein
VRFDAARALVCVAPLIGDGVGLAAISRPTNVVLAGDREPVRGFSIPSWVGAECRSDPCFRRSL